MPRLRNPSKLSQDTGSDENLVARPPKKLQHQLSQETPRKALVKRKNESQDEDNITAEVLACEELTGDNDKYWRQIAEQHQNALYKVLDENNTLKEEIEEMRRKVAENKRMLEEVEILVDVIQGELANDSGIDVNNISSSGDNEEDAANENEET